MEIEDVLRTREQGIVDEAYRRTAEIERYRRDGAPVTRRRVEALYRELTAAVQTRDVTGLRAYAREVARERAAAGYSLADVEAALAALEDALWDGALALLPAYDQAFAHGLVATALAHARDALRHGLDPAAPHAPAPDPDLSPLFRGASERLGPPPTRKMIAA